jgi:hypothetical protein
MMAVREVAQSVVKAELETLDQAAVQERQLTHKEVVEAVVLLVSSLSMDKSL